jgi:hypothetical protein
MQPSQPFPTQQLQPHHAPPPPSPRRNRRLALVSTAVVVVAIIVLYFVFAVHLPAAQLAAAQPKFTLTEAAYNSVGCAPFELDQRIFDWVYNLTNTGNANGFATVTFFVNNDSVGQSISYVPAGGWVWKSATVYGPNYGSYPCPADIPYLAITSVMKA